MDLASNCWADPAVVGSEQSSSKAVRRPRILLVDDEESASSPLVRLLRLGGFDTDFVLTGAEALSYALIRAGEPLMDGPSNPHDILGSPPRTLARWGGVLSVLGEKALHAYLVNEIQKVYRLQGVNINDKHISWRAWGPTPHARALALA